MSKKFWVIGGCVLLSGAVLAALLQLLLPRVLPLPVYMSVPAMTLRDQNDQPFELRQTRGKITVISIIYTHCPDICPLTTARLQNIQTRVAQAGWSDRVYLLTFTIDPARDLPVTLRRFAETREVDFTNWSFLAGDEAQTKMLIENFGLYVERVYVIDGEQVSENALRYAVPPETPYLVNHTDRIFIADRLGRVRAVEPGSRADISRVMQVLGELLQETVP